MYPIKRKKLTAQEQLDIITKYEVNIEFNDREFKGDPLEIHAFPNALCNTKGASWECISYTRKRDTKKALEEVLYLIKRQAEND